MNTRAMYDIVEKRCSYFRLILILQCMSSELSLRPGILSSDQRVPRCPGPDPPSIISTVISFYEARKQ